MWTVEIIGTEIESSGALRISALFAADGVSVARSVQVFNPSLSSIKAALRLERARLAAASAVIPDIPVGVIDIDTPDEANAAPSALEIYQAAFRDYRAVKTQFDAGLVSQFKVATALEKLQAAYQPEFLGAI